jgi:heme/copper-type cytochrome/quinol oxidase subunit 2
MLEKNEKNLKHSYSSNPTLLFYLVIFMLLFCSRLFDMSTTYLATPNLAMESNIMVTTLGLGWFRFIVLNILITLAIFLLFKISWSRFSNGRTNKNKQNPKPRNVPLEIGITLPIYVIITGNHFAHICDYNRIFPGNDEYPDLHGMDFDFFY